MQYWRLLSRKQNKGNIKTLSFTLENKNNVCIQYNVLYVFSLFNKIIISERRKLPAITAVTVNHYMADYFYQLRVRRAVIMWNSVAVMLV